MGTASNPAFMLIWLLLLIVVTAVFVFVVIRYLRRSNGSVLARVSEPVCGRCRYVVAENPNGLSICPECGLSYREVGIIAPGTRLPGGAVLNGLVIPIVWVALCVGLVVMTCRVLEPVLTKTLVTTTVRQTRSPAGQAPALRGLSLQLESTIESFAIPNTPIGRPGSTSTPRSARLDLELTSSGSSPVTATLELPSMKITASSVPSLAGQKLDSASARQLIAAAAGKSLAPQSEDIDQLVSSIQERSADSGQGQLFGTNTTITTGGRSGSRLSTQSTPLATWNSSLSTRGGSGSSSLTMINSSSSLVANTSSVTDVFIGSLRGRHWLIGLATLGGFALMLMGFVVMRWARRRESVTRLP